jgi:hypothetical protein
LVTSKEAEGPRDCRRAVPIVAEVNGVGETGQSTMTNVEHSWRPFWRTSRLGIIVLNYSSIRTSRVSPSRLQEFYSMLFIFRNTARHTYIYTYKQTT